MICRICRKKNVSSRVRICAQRRDQRADLLAGEHLVEARAFDVENLAA
jgi:hypothetical protein